jgi:hypothetical protein
VGYSPLSKKYKKDLGEAVAAPMSVAYGVPLSKLRDFGRYRSEARLIPEHKGDKGKANSEKDLKKLNDC